MTLSTPFDLPLPDAIAQLTGRGVVLPDTYYNDLPAEARRVAFSVSGLAQLNQIQTVLDRLGEHLTGGGTLASFQKWAAGQDWSLPKHRLETIFRNAVQTAYSAGHWRHFEEAKDARPYLMYDAINDSRVRPAHLAMDGMIRRVDDPFWRTHSPPLGHRCRCSLISLNEAQAHARSNPGNDSQPRGVHKPVTPDMKADDEGWGRRPDREREETLRRLLEKRLGMAPPGYNDIMTHFLQPAGELSIYDKDWPSQPPDVSTPRNLAIVTFENEIRNDVNLETGAFFDDAGKMYLRRTDKPDHVSYTEDEMLSMIGMTFSHNHPNGASFSVDDLTAGAEYLLKEVRAVTGLFRHSASGPWPRPDEIARAYQEEFASARADAFSAMVMDGMRPVFLDAESIHRAWARVAKRLGFQYRREKA